MLIRKINRSVFLRLFFSYMIIIILGLGLVGLFISFIVEGYIYDTKRDELLRKARMVNLTIQQEPTMSESDINFLVFFDQSFDTRIWVFDRAGKVIATSTTEEVSKGKTVDTAIVESVISGDNVTKGMVFEGLTKPMLSVAIPWGKGQEVYGGIVLHSSIAEAKGIVSNIRETVLWGILLGIVISVALISYLSWSISRPLQKIDAAAAEIGLGNYSKRIDVTSEDEIGELATTINTMAEKLEKIEGERQKLDRIRTDFLANVSHELRTPLTAMQGFLEALQDGLISEDARDKYYDIMYSETIHMNRLLDDIMHFIRLRNKEVLIERYPVNVKSLVEKVMLKLDKEMKAKHNTFEQMIPENIPEVYADQVRIEQIISNIVKNSIKFTENGLISLTVEEDGPYVRFDIKDTGIGMSEADLEYIWERFYKADRGRSKRDSGTGLGLAIVKELVELHEGKIEVKSELGEGSIFTIWIPSVKQH